MKDIRGIDLAGPEKWRMTSVAEGRVKRTMADEQIQVGTRSY